MSDPKEIDIKLFLDPDSDPPFRLKCDTLPQGTKSGDYIFANQGFPGFLLNYVLQEPTHGYRFPDDLDEALYSQKGTQCPKQKGQWGQFKAKEVSPDNKTLVVRNMNQKGHEGNFAYTLRVTKTPHNDNAEFMDLDPGGTNTNGSSRSNVALAVAVVVTVVVVGVVAYELGAFGN